MTTKRQITDDTVKKIKKKEYVEKPPLFAHSETFNVVSFTDDKITLHNERPDKDGNKLIH
jgi:hypothetical protein